jgi:hypothetical protein
MCKILNDGGETAATGMVLTDRLNNKMHLPPPTDPTSDGDGSPNICHRSREGRVVESCELPTPSFRGAVGSNQVLMVAFDDPCIVIDCRVWLWCVLMEMEGLGKKRPYLCRFACSRSP